MKFSIHRWTASAAFAAFTFACTPNLQAEEPVAPEKGKDAKEGKDKDKRDERNVNRNTLDAIFGGEGREWRGGGGGGFTEWGGGGGFTEWGGGGGMASRQSRLGSALRMLGIEIDDSTSATKIQSLPLGADRKHTLNVPVGGVANPGTATGWKMEAIFKLTDEQTQSLDVLRKEYETECTKLENEIAEQRKVLATKAVDLRKKFEVRANDVLTGADKEAKAKIDALSAEADAKIAATIKDAVALYDQDNYINMSHFLRPYINKIALETESKLVELLPADSKVKIKEVFQQQARYRGINERANRGLFEERIKKKPEEPKKPEEAPPGNF